MTHFIRLFVSGLLLWLSVAGVRAHDPGLSTAEVTVRGGEVQVALAFAPADAKRLRIGPEPWPLVRVGELLVVRVAGRLREARSAEIAHASGDNVTLRMVYPRSGGDAAFSLEVRAFEKLPAGHRLFAFVAGPAGERLGERLLGGAERGFEIALAAEAKPGVQERVKPVVVSESFFRLGVRHILTGFDHLLFLAGLLLVSVRVRSMLAIITCFTVAHSLTLALAALEILDFSPRWVEPLIAATVVFVGVENVLARGKEPAARWALTFSFGLVHGFGFAGVLRELGLGTQGGGVAWPLLSFNLGVETGQLAVAAVVLPLLWWLRRYPWFARRGVTVLSVAIALAGLYWLLQRTLWA